MNEVFFIEIDENDAGKRIDTFLADEIDGITRSYLQKLIESDDIKVENRQKTSKNYKLRDGDIISVNLPEPKQLKVEAENIPINIIYEDRHLLVVDKPQGMVVHPAAGNYSGTLVNAIMFHCGDELSSINGVIRPGIVHRIDKDTSGLLVIAKTNEAHIGLSEQFQEHSIKRAYRAVVYNNIKEDEGRVDAPIGRNPKDRLKMAVTSLSEGRRAVTNYKVVQRAGNFTHIECRLETGRTHQIRVHMAYINHPLLGDPVYGPKKGAFGITAQVLHAAELGFVHPITEEYMEFRSELPKSFVKALRKAGFSEAESR
ncbi:MAG: RluA family pseudouridine synthase [Firmicutes bacterium]|nr:RluA family pseudouridine synthase [Bacillota bacterium]